MDKRAIVHRVNEWADWVIRMSESSPLGYPSRSTEGRLMSEGGRVDNAPPGSLVPLIQMPARIAAVDRAIKAMPEAQADLLKAHHLLPGSSMGNMRMACKRVGISRAKYYASLDCAYYWIGGSISD